MDGNLYNYAGASNMWNGYNEGFQPPPLDLQNYMPTNRDHFPREQNKNPLVPAAPPYVFFNYPDETAHQHHHHHHHQDNINRNQWHFPAWPKMKSRPEAAHTAGKRHMDKHFHKDNELAMPMIHPGVSGLNIPPPGGFCTPDASDRIIDEAQRLVTVMEPHDETNASIPVSSAHANSFPAPLPSTARRSIIRKNPTPRKRKEKPKKEEKPAKKRTRDEEKWARNIRKKARSKGESYVSVQGKQVPARSVKPVDCSKCKFNCPSRVSEEEREKLFREYWDLENFKDKVDFIASCVHEFAPLRPVSGRRSYSRRYMLKVNGKEERVCKEFFVTTFDISESTIVTYMGKKRKGDEIIADMRGKQTPSNKTPDSTIRVIREHILSQIGLQGEFTRSPSEDVKNVKRLYRDYQAECEFDEIKPASISVYRKVFSDMHKDKTDTPVELPPESVLMQNANTKKKLKTVAVEKENSLSASAVDEDDIPLNECSLTSEADDSQDSQPPLPAVISSPTSTALSQTASPYDLGLIPNPYQNSVQHMTTEPVKRLCTSSLNIPHTMQQQQGQNQLHQPRQQQQQQPQPFPQHHQQHPSYGGDPLSASHDRGHMNTMLPFMWESGRQVGSSASTDPSMGYGPVSYPNQGQLVQPPVSALSSSLFNYRISSASSTSSQSASTTVIQLPTSAIETNLKPHQAPSVEGSGNKRKSNAKKSGEGGRGRKAKENAKKEPKKRTRNEDSWGRNVRKRLRFKGEAYTSVRGKLVEAKRIQPVDCSKCKFKCTSRVTDEQREKLNEIYWSLDTYQKKIEFLTKYVATYTPKRKMTGRRAFSRKYTFDVDGHEERVCKDFFKATLHISESTIATALEKSRKGPEAIVDMRGKHKPVNKTTEETLQNIRELIIYLTGMRPHRASNNSRLGSEYRDVNRLYQVYKYDSEKKGKKVASLGIFRNVLVKEFCIKTAKLKKNANADEVNEDKIISAEPSVSSVEGSWPISVPQPALGKLKTPALSELLPKSVTEDDAQFSDINIPTM